MKFCERMTGRTEAEIFESNGLFWKYANIAVLIILNFIYFILAIHENFWYDEAYTVGMVLRDFSDIISITSQDVHTPFYYCVLKLFYHTIGMEHLISIKIFSWIFLFAYFVFGGWVCRKHYSRKVEFFWLVLSGFMPAMVIQSTSARMYTFGLFWVTVASYLAYSLFREEKRSKWILFVLTTIISIYIHTFSMLEMVIVYLLFMTAVIAKKRYKTLRNILIAGVTVSCSYIPWLLVLWKQFSRWAGWESGWSNTIQPFGLSSIKTYLAEWFSSIENPQPVVICFGIGLFLYAGFHTVKYIKETKDYLPSLSLIVAGIVLGLAIAVTVLIVPCFLGRYLFPVFGGIWLFCAVGLSRVRVRRKQWIAVFGVVLCGLFAFQEELSLEDETGLSSYREFIDNEWSEEDIIMADTYFLMMMSIYHPEADYMIYGSMPSCLPFDNCQVFTQWQQLENVETVWYLSFDNFKAGNLDEEYVSVEKREIPFSYYNIILEKYIRKESVIQE